MNGEKNDHEIYKISGKDVFGCKTQLKADGAVWYEPLRAWYCTQKTIDRFKARGFRVKVLFAKVEVDPSAWEFYTSVTGAAAPSHL